MRVAFGCALIAGLSIGPAIAGSWIDTKETGTSPVSNSSQGLDSSVANRILPYALMSDAVYGDSPSSDAKLLAQGWKQGGTETSKGYLFGGLTATVYGKTYENGKVEYVIVFKGSDRSVNDWLLANIEQWRVGPRGTAQYMDALNITKQIIENIKKASPDAAITIAGHSLGGGIAQYVGTELKLNTITFNAAGLSTKAGYKNGVNYNVANINSNADVVHKVDQTAQVGQQYLFEPKAVVLGFMSIGYNHGMIEMINNLSDISSAYSQTNFASSAINRTTATATTTVAQVSATGPINFQPAQVSQPKTTAQPKNLGSGTNTYTEGGWTVTYGLQSGLRQGVSGSELGLSTNNDGFTVISNQGAPFIYAQKTFKAGSGNNDTFNFDALAAFITTEHQRCAPCTTFGLDRSYITFISSSGQQVTKSLQEVYGVNRFGRVEFPNNPGNGTLTTPLRRVVQSMQMARGSTMKVIINVNNSVNNDTRYPSSYAITNVRAR